MKEKPKKPQKRRKSQPKRVVYAQNLRSEGLLQKIDEVLEKNETLTEDQIKALEEQKLNIIKISKQIKVLQVIFEKEKEQAEWFNKINLVPGSKQNPLLLLLHFGAKAYAARLKKKVKESEVALDRVTQQGRKEIDNISNKVKEILSKPKPEALADKETKTKLRAVLASYQKAVKEMLDSGEYNEEQKAVLKKVSDEIAKVTGEKIENVEAAPVSKPPVVEEQKKDKETAEVADKIAESVTANLDEIDKKLKEINKTQSESLDDLEEALKKLESFVPKTKEEKELYIKELRKIQELLSSLPKIEKSVKEQTELEKDAQYQKKDTEDVPVKEEQKPLVEKKAEEQQKPVEEKPAPSPIARVSGKALGVVGAGAAGVAAVGAGNVGSTIANIASGTAKAAGAGAAGAGAGAGAGAAGLEGAKRLPKILQLATKGKVLPKLFKYGGPLAYLAGQTVEGISTKTPKDELAAKTIGGLLGLQLGAMGGAALGSIVPGVGTAAGGAVGGAVGGIAGTFLGEQGTLELYKLIKSKLTGGDKDTIDLTQQEAATKEKRKLDKKLKQNRPQAKFIEGESVEGSQLAELESVLGPQLAQEAAKVAITEGGYDRKLKQLKTDSINKESLTAGMFQFTPTTALDVASKIEDQNLKKKFQPYLEQKQKTGKIDREGVSKLVASLSVKEQAILYKKYLEPLINQEGGIENITAEKMKAYGFAPASQLGDKSPEAVIYKEGSKAYELNKFLDPNRSGDVTKEEIEKQSEKIIKKGESSFEDFIAANKRIPATPKQKEEQVVLAKNRPITPSTAVLARESATRSEREQAPVQVAVNTQNINNISKGSKDEAIRGDVMNTRNPDPIYQKSLEKSYYG